MANTIKHKRGSGSDPSASDLVAGELAIRTDTGVVFTKKDDGTVAQIAGGGDTDLGVSTTSTAVTVTSSTGNNATISEASGSAAGVMSVAHHDKLDGIESNATADQTASEILTLIKTVDGSGSGLDAAALEGLGAGSFIRSNADDTVSGHTEWQDNKEVRLGNSADLKLYHDGTNSYIDGGTGDTYIRGNGDDLYLLAADDVFIQTQNGETAAKFIGDGAVQLNYDNSQKFATKSDGVDITGELQCDSLDVDGGADITGTTTLHGNLDLQDNDQILIGSGDDLQLFHNATNSEVVNNTGDLFIKNNANDKDILLQTDNGSGGTTSYIVCDGSTGDVKLYQYGNQKLQTFSSGVDITGELQCDTLDVDGNGDVAGTLTVNSLVVDDDGSGGPVVQIRTDDASPWALQISNDSWSSGTNRGLLTFQANDGNVYTRVQGVSNNWEAYYIQQNNGSTTNVAVEISLNREVKLHYQGSQKLITKSDGVDITGELQCDSLDVDGAANITGNVDINGDIRHNGDTNCLFGFPSNDTFRISTGGTERFRITSTGAIAIEGSSNYGTSGQVLTSNGNDAPTWQDGGGTVASGCVYENSQTISSNYSVTSGKNAMSAGPITIASGVTVTVTSGSTYTIV